MKQNIWKKIIGIFLLMGVLVLSFWYGGNAPGLQGFSVNSEVNETEAARDNTNKDRDNIDGNNNDNTYNGIDNDNSERLTVSKNIDRDDNSDSNDSKKEKKSGLFSQIVMKVKKIGSSNKSKENNPQLNKKAQKNANRAADKTIKKNKANKKKTAADNSSGDTKSDNDNNASKSNNIDKKTENSSDNNYSENTDAASDIPSNSDNDRKANNSGDANDNNKAETGGNADNKTSNISDNNTGSTKYNNGKTYNQGTVSTESREEKSDKPANGDYITCTIYISCASVLDHMDKLSGSVKKVIPSDGVILNLTTVKVKKDATVFDVLQKAARDNKIHLEYNFTPAYKTYYIEGIGNLYQFDAGNLSGWLYSVNDEYPGVGCSACKVKDGDSIKWVYTCNFGKDVGGYIE